MKVKITFATMLAMMLSVSAWSQAPQVSTDESVTWYNVVSASPDASGLLMTDNYATSPAFPVALKTPENGTFQQWKLVKEASSGLLRFVNRSTGRIIQPVSVASDLYNVIQLGSSVIVGSGFSLESLGNGEYAISGVESDGVTRYLISAKENTAASASAVTTQSAYAWTFQEVQEVGINDAVTETPTISVRNGRVVVTPTAPFLLRSVDGITLPSDSRLMKGIYMVTVNGKTTKIFINE